MNAQHFRKRLYAKPKSLVKLRCFFLTKSAQYLIKKSERAFSCKRTHDGARTPST